jgi:pimeloyl-ACP methyl ester carboxylesterase
LLELRSGTAAPARYTIDRRGRGESEDAADYSMALEADDLVAVVDFIGRPTTVLGHSYGAACALDAALRTDRIERLILYEPGVLEGVTGYYRSERVAASVRTIEGQLHAGDTEPALVTILRELIELSDDDIKLMQSMPAWQGRVAAAHTVLRELQGEATWMFEAERYGRVTVPTLLLTGSESFQIARDGTAALHEALPNSRVVVLEGQGHGAMTTAPDLFVSEVLAFLADA